MTYILQRREVFRAFCDVLREEERCWADALLARPGARDRFEWVWGVRAAAEVAIGYLVLKRLLTTGMIEGHCWPERPCANGGRMDLWLGKDANHDCHGLGIEFKYVMSRKEAGTVPAQADRLCQPPNEAAAFILWGHGIVPGSALDPQTYLGGRDNGWRWSLEAQDDFDAMAPGGNVAKCRVWLWGADCPTSELTAAR